MDANERSELLRAGIEAAQNGNNITARGHFRRILEQHPDDEQVWLYMVRVVDTKVDKQRCLEKVLEINPNNETAKEAAKRLGITLRGGLGRVSRDTMDDLRRSSLLPADDLPESTYSAATGTITTTGGTEQQRDWFQPVDREARPPELWRAQQTRPNFMVMGMVAIIALGFIGLAVLLILNELDDDTETAQESTLAQVDIDATGTQTALEITPTMPVIPSTTPRPTVLRQPDLPPTAAPELTNTPLPSPTNTRTPNPPSNYDLLFSSSLFPFDGDPYRVFTIAGDGANLIELTINLPELEVLPSAAPTESTVIEEPTDVSDEDDGEEDAVAEETATVEPQTDPLAGRIELIDPSYSPDGQFIVFTGQVGAIQELFVVSATGNGSPRQLTLFSASLTRDAEWSPDGQRIVFSSNADGDEDIYVINANSTTVAPESADVTKMTLNDVIVDREPTWSPDGQYIAFQSDRLGGATFQIFVQPLQGNEICQMTDSSGSNITPDWSPDGSQIIFISNRDGDNDLFIMRSDGTNERAITVRDGNWEERDPKWSPDQEWIVVSSTRVESGSTASVNPTSKLWMLTPNGDEWRGVSIGESNDLDASFSPTGDAVDASNFAFECASR